MLLLLRAWVPDGLGVDVFLYVFSPTHTATVGRCANLNDYLIDSMNKTGYFFLKKVLCIIRNVEKYYSCFN